MSDQEKIKWFNRGIRFQMDGYIFLTMKSRKSGVCTWVIEDFNTGKLLNSDLKWDEDLPSKKRDNDFVERTRFDFEKAKGIYEQFRKLAA